MNSSHTHSLAGKIKKNLFVKFAHRIDGKGHIDGVTKIIDLYTPSDAGGHSQSAEFVVLKVIFSDVAIATNEEPIVEENVEDDAVVSRAPIEEGARESNGGCWRTVRRVN